MAAARSRTGGRSRRGRSGRPWWRWRPPSWAAVLAVVVAVVATWLVMRPSSVERRADELREEAAAADLEVGADLVDTAVEVLPDVQQVVHDTHDVLPTEDAPDQPVDTLASPEQLDTWRASIEEARDDLADVGSAGTAVNVARNGLVVASEHLLVVLDLYQDALDLEPEQADALLADVGVARRAAVESWNTAAIQVDVVSIDSGIGHSHVYVSGIPGQPPPDDGGE